MMYQNIDFGTVKGFSTSYDLRRTGRVQMTTNYTLQFADGTGSSKHHLDIVWLMQGQWES